MRAASALAVALLTGCAAAPPAAPDDVEALAAERDEVAYVIAYALVTEVGPRFTGTPGNARAIDWAVHKLGDLGFQNVHAEPVTAPHWERGTIRLEVRSPAKEALDAVALGGSVGTKRGGITAPVLAVPSLDALAQLPDAAVKGRIVYLGTRMERTRDGSGYNKAVVIRRNGPAAAGRKGALAVLIRSVATGGTAPHTGTTKYDDGPKIPAAALAPADADRLEQLVAAGPVSMHLEMSSHDAGEAQTANVIGEIPGETSEIVLLGAHLDSWDITPGANDDAAGVGIVVAAARRLGLRGQKPHRTIRVVLFANEEFGASGAKAYAAAHADELARHVAVMEADSGSGAVYTLRGTTADADWPFIAELATKLHLELGKNGEEGHVDVGELRKLGVPEIFAGQDASAYFDVHHTTADTVATLDRAGLAQAEGVFSALAFAASERPGLGRVTASGH